MKERTAHAVLRVAGRWVLVMLFVSLGFGWTAGATKEQKITIVLNEFNFSPAKVTLQAGVPAEIKLVNKGKVEHEFQVYVAPKGKVADWDEYAMANTYFKDMGEVEAEFEEIGAVAGTRVFEVKVQPGKEAALKFTPARKGTFEMACHTVGHYEAGMKGVLTVK